MTWNCSLGKYRKLLDYISHWTDESATLQQSAQSKKSPTVLMQALKLTTRLLINGSTFIDI